MAISQAQYIDLLVKKLFGVAKTDTNPPKAPSNESIASPPLLAGDIVWTQSDQIPATAQTVSGITQSYLGGSSVQCTADPTVGLIGGVNPTWLTGLTDWIPSEFGSTWLVKVYAGPPGAANIQSTGTQLFAAGSGGTGEYFFDNQAGLLNFIGNTIPASLTSGNVIYVSGYRYIGLKGVTNLPGNTVIGNLKINGNTITSTLANGNVTLTANGTGVVNVTGNVAANYYFGNGSQLTGINASSNKIFNGNSYANIATTDGNLVIGIAGNEWSFGTDGNLSLAGNLNLSGNTFDVYYANGTQVSLGGNYGNSDVAAFLSDFGSNTISTTGNISAGYYYGNGYYLTGIIPPTSIINQTVEGNNVANTFTLLQSATANTVLVTINGITQTPDVDYDVAGNSITFSTAPYNGDVVQIRFLAVAGPGGGSGGNSSYIINGFSWANVTSPSGNIVINTNGPTWTFGTSGNLTLPNSSNFGDAAITQTDTNTSGVNSSTGTFPYLNYNINLVGYKVNGPGVVNATVASQDQGTSTIVITGGVFQAGQSYRFSTAFGTVGTGLEVDGSNWIFGFDGNTTLPGNVSAAGNITASGFLTGVASLTGNAQSGDNALYAGIQLFTHLPSNVVAQFSGNANSYSQINFQNIDPGIASTTDYIATADNGSDTIHFIDMGIAGGSYVPGSYNSLGSSLNSNDGYMYVQGTGNGQTGNLVIGTNEANGVVRIIADGSDTANIVAEFSKTGISAVGNITGNYILGNGSQLTGIQASAGEAAFTIQSNNFAATTGNRYGVNTVSNSVTATLPASPATGGAIFFADAGGAFATNNLVVNPNGRTIMGATGNMTVSTNNQSFGLFYNGSTWRTYNAG